MQCRGELRRPDALGLAVVAERAEDDRTAEPVPLPGPGLLDHDLDHLTGAQVTLDVPQRSETRLSVKRIVGRQLRPQVPHAGSQAPFGLQQFHVALGRVQERDERIEPLGADELPPVGVGVDGGVERHHRLIGHADVHVQVQLDGAAEPHRAPLPAGRRSPIVGAAAGEGRDRGRPGPLDSAHLIHRRGSYRPAPPPVATGPTTPAPTANTSPPPKTPPTSSEKHPSAPTASSNESGEVVLYI